MASPPGSTTSRGRAAEEAAARVLDAHGLTIVDRNFTAAGAELDLVARDSEGTCVFVEVRSRASTAHGDPIDTVGRDKQRRIIRAATAWLVKHELWERVEVRFDVIGVRLDAQGQPQGEPTWIRDAFAAH